MHRHVWRSGLLRRGASTWTTSRSSRSWSRPSPPCPSLLPATIAPGGGRQLTALIDLLCILYNKNMDGTYSPLFLLLLKVANRQRRESEAEQPLLVPDQHRLPLLRHLQVHMKYLQYWCTAELFHSLQGTFCHVNDRSFSHFSRKSPDYQGRASFFTALI